MPVASSWFWNERFWLPSNVTWADLRNSDEAKFPQIEDLYMVFPYALLIFIVRMVFERFIATPIAMCLGIKTKRANKAEPNTILEKVYKTVTNSPSKKHVEGLSKQLDWTPRQVERWFRHRRNQERPTLLKKFGESSWRCLFYLGAFVYAFQYLRKQIWFFDTRHCWYEYPMHPLTEEMEKYYLIELSFYWSLIFSQFLDVKRKDFLQMFLHHVVTISLLCFSWVTNMVRIGALVIIVHDGSDILLEAAKMTNYAKFQRVCDFLFICFGIVFFITRLVIYPLHVLRSVGLESREIIGPYSSWYVFFPLLFILQFLHIFWFSIILRMVFKALKNGKVEKDDRSDCEETSSDEDSPTNNGRIGHGNCNSNHKH